MRKPIVIGNWKMFLSLKESVRLVLNLQEELKTLPIDKVDVVICPSFTALPSVQPFLNTMQLGAQDCCWEEKGAFTGEVSAAMLKELGCKYVLIGHSERRTHAAESDAVINKKVHAALKEMLIPVLCVGESAKQRDDRLTDYAVMQQLKSALEGVKLVGSQQLIIAYEPVWAIGTGRPVSPDEPNRVHQIIRHTLLDFFSSDVINNRIRTIYGGSVDSKNILGFTNQSAEDGVLVGGASVRVEDFIKIVKRVAI